MGERRGRARAQRRELAAQRADPLGRVRQVEAELDDAGEEVPSATEEAAGLLLGGLVGRAAQEQLVDELGAREDAGPRDAGRLGPRDEGVAVQPFELDAIHAARHGAPGR